jgi:hypothetical protein
MACTEMTSPASTRHPIPRALLAMLAAICAASTLFPGDAPFINDEPTLIYKALRAIQRGELEHAGLQGTQKFRYGPIPTWLYQAMLHVSHDLKMLTVMRALLLNIITAAALLWLARTVGLNPWFSVVIMLSPYGWHYSRQLWDNSLCIPLSALALAAYASFLSRRGSLSLAITLSCMILLLLVHLMAIALVAPMLLHMIIFRWRDLLRRWPTLLGVAIGGAIISLPYIGALRETHPDGSLPTGAAGWWFPLLGSRIISGANLSYLFPPDWMTFAGPDVRALLYAAWAISLLSYPLMWLGLVYATIIAFRWLARRRKPAALLQQLAVLGLMVIAAQIVLDGIWHVYGHPHYYNGTWIIFPLLAWIGFDLLLRRFSPARFVLPVYAAAMGMLTFFVAAGVHRNHGVRSVNYGLCLGDEINVVRQLNALGGHGPFTFALPDGRVFVDDPFNWGRPTTTVYTTIPTILLFPQSLNVLQELIDPGDAKTPVGAALAIQLQGNDPDSVEVRVVKLVAATKPSR